MLVQNEGMNRFICLIELHLYGSFRCTMDQSLVLAPRVTPSSNLASCPVSVAILEILPQINPSFMYLPRIDPCSDQSILPAPRIDRSFHGPRMTRSHQTLIHYSSVRTVPKYPIVKVFGVRKCLASPRRIDHSFLKYQHNRSTHPS